jgi:hypothetical protein
MAPNLAPSQHDLIRDMILHQKLTTREMADGRMEEWKAPWLTTESGFADIVIGIGVIKSGNVYECDV